VIARVWRGVVAAEDGDAYAEYMRETGIEAYARTPGNRGAWMLRRPVADGEEFVMLTLWDSLESIKAFAGEDYEAAVFYPRDDEFLIRRETRSTHYEVDTYEDPHR
jgi:heme-degrading monooxygenase HmoA